MIRVFSIAVLTLGCITGPIALAGQKVDETLPTYSADKKVAGTIKIVGSDTMLNMATAWTEGFGKVHPGVQPEIVGKGSSTAIPALIQGSAHFGPMSRDPKAKELDDFEKKFGYKPTALATSIDMLAVYVHKDNPIKSLNMKQIDAIYSKTRKGGNKEEILTWGQLGLEGEWADKPINLYGRNSASGTYGYFKEHCLFNGDYKDTVKEMPGSSAVVQAVGKDKFAMGYSGIGYKTPEVRAVPLARDEDSDAVEALPDHGYSGEYPLARYLWLVVNHRPGQALDPVRGEFLRYVFSKAGQSDVVRDGYLPITGEIAKKMLQKVEISE